jgi:hypothetical protein
MSAISGSYDIGYGKPPRKTRWKKAQCSNPKRIRKRRNKTLVQMVDELFASEIEISQNGVSCRVQVLEAILYQLWCKAMTGSKRATNVLLKYHEFAAKRGHTGGVEIVVG